MRGWLEFPQPVVAQNVTFSRPIGILDGEDSIYIHGVIGVLIRASVHTSPILEYGVNYIIIDSLLFLHQNIKTLCPYAFLIKSVMKQGEIKSVLSFISVY